jgi:hypothetical protein
MRRRAELSLIRVLAIYFAGAIAGAQVALYLFDFYNDGVADLRSLLIGLLFIAFGLVFALWSFLPLKKSGRTIRA